MYDSVFNFGVKLISIMSKTLTNLSVVLERTGDLQVKLELEPPSPPHGHVQVAMRSVGICGTNSY